MIDDVIYTPEAEDDVANAYKWYEEREVGLGEEFLRCVEACVSGIRRQPMSFRVAVDEFRRAKVRRFPFDIFYEAEHNRIVIHFVFHSAQDPRKWRERLG
jgi:plasmid stabilization system protein ParE